jgi:hypothetical protein
MYKPPSPNALICKFNTFKIFKYGLTITNKPILKDHNYTKNNLNIFNILAKAKRKKIPMHPNNNLQNQKNNKLQSKKKKKSSTEAVTLKSTSKN